MEKGEKMDCESLATLNVGEAKDFESTLDYQDAPPGYSKGASTRIQVTKIVAVAAVTIAAMLSVALVFSAWLSSSSCHQSGLEGFLPPPEHLRLRSILSAGHNDLDISETKVARKQGSLEGLQRDKKDKPEAPASSSSSSEEDDGSGEDAAVTMLKLPFEISLQEHMFDRNHRSHMNCVIEKKKAEEIVDEQSKPLPALLGLNMTSDPRYLHFSGEKMAISCDSGNEHRPASQPHPQPILPNPFNPFAQQPPSGRSHHPQPHPLSEMLTSALGSSSLPIHIIGPIPLTQAEAQQFQQVSTGPFQSPPQFSSQFQQQQQSPRPHFFQGPQQAREELIGLGPFGALGLPPHLIPILMQGNQLTEDEASSRQTSGPAGPLFYPPSGSSRSQEYQRTFNTGPSSGEVERERALPQPIPIMPRAHVQHLIRPRRSAVEEPQVPVKRMKRCACDCACKNHPLE